ncbi:GTP pyrophosphokinase [Shimazuella alba]|uniref:GTP pyrophosphokinase n=1 Tax=Shimazuella alba TaxID=2690964 RepID=A0A6I4VXM5_9BACL|nr:GTP pyrophosphokinase [Shimazuella alba]MXQ55451.1 GTP pyrophosphokinase [Shimazuella alba]
MHLLEKAILIAAQAHQGQVDKGGNPYILHPLAVMSHVGTWEAKMVAVMHDVLEDTDVTLEELQEKGFPVEVLDALMSVTRQEGETYVAFIDRIAKNKLATEVKLADLKENMNLDRIPNPNNTDKERLAKYQRAYRKLKNQ